MSAKTKKRRTMTPAEPPQRYKERPTAERMMRGKWRLGETIDAGIKVAIDDAAHPLEALHIEGMISTEQYTAACDFEALYRAQLEIPQSRDSCTIWEPRGETHGDGPVEERKRYRELCRSIGMIHESKLIFTAVHQNFPKGPKAMGEFREACNAAAHFFAPGGKKRLHPFSNAGI
jgi:hypothetical protein